MDYAYPDLTKLYRWPFGITDNPNVVIEPTAYCDLSCPHCYRDSSNLERDQAVMRLKAVKRYIDVALELRRFDTLSFLGGEPLLYEDLDEAILYGVNKGLNVGLYTNGTRLSKYRLRELEGLGLSYIYVHVDRHQGRGETEEETIRLREYYCDMFRKTRGINFGFGVILHEEDLADLDKLVGFLQRNADVVRFANLSLLGPCPKPGASQEEILEECERVDAFQKKMCQILREAFGFAYCSYLGSKYRADTPGKLLAVSAYRDGELLGSLRPEEFRSAVERYRSERGRYPYLLSRPCNAYMERCDRLGQDVNWQYIAISLSPLLLPEGVVNICHSCTDCVLHEDRFVPMCQLDPIRGGDVRVISSVRYWS